MGRRGKSYKSNLKGPPKPKAWWSYNLNNGGCPVVIRRKRGYIQTRLQDLTKWEKILAEERAKPPEERHPDAIANLEARVANRRAWLDYSIEVLRNCTRFALARIETDSEDHKLLREKRAEAGIPIKKKTGRVNKAFHDELRFYADTLEEYIAAKMAAAGNSRSDEAMKKVWKLCEKAVNAFTHKTFVREKEDSQQQAALGIMRACKHYNVCKHCLQVVEDYHAGEIESLPWDKGRNAKISPYGHIEAHCPLLGRDQASRAAKLAKLSTYATHWIRRMVMDVRKGSDLKPGLAKVDGDFTSVKSVYAPTDDDDDHRADSFHPVSDSSNHELRMDVLKALSLLPREERLVAEQHLLHGETLVQIAENIGLSPAQVRSRLKKAKQSLCRHLADHAA